MLGVPKALDTIYKFKNLYYSPNFFVLHIKKKVRGIP
jgi:hypothetical protein